MNIKIHNKSSVSDLKERCKKFEGMFTQREAKNPQFVCVGGGGISQRRKKETESQPDLQVLIPDYNISNPSQNAQFNGSVAIPKIKLIP